MADLAALVARLSLLAGRHDYYVGIPAAIAILSWMNEGAAAPGGRRFGGAHQTTARPVYVGISTVSTHR